jgi:AmiR/NasT family two-component response regulator
VHARDLEAPRVNKGALWAALLLARRSGMLSPMDVDGQRRLEQLTQAVQHRTTIGIAMGIVMERLGLDAHEAFAYLRCVSSHQNRKLYVIAGEIATSRDLPAP